jgi:hypothetical protein
VVHVEVEESGVDPEHEHVGEELVLRVPDRVGEVVGSPHPPELGGVRPRAPPEEQQHRDYHPDQHPPQQARPQDAEEGGHGHAELAALEAPQPLQLGQLEEAGDRHEDDGREHGLGQVAQEPREEEGDRRDDAGGEEAGEGRSGPAPLVHQGLRHAAAHREAPAEAGGEVAPGQREELLVAVEPVAVLAGERPADRDRLDGPEQEAGHRQGQEEVEVGGVDAGQAGGGEALRHLAEERHPPVRETEERHRGDAAHEDEERHGPVG